MKPLNRLLRLLLVLLFVVLPAMSWAAPTTYGFDSGTVTVRATTGLTELAVADIEMDGVFVTFDPATLSLDDFAFHSTGSSPIVLSQSYGDIVSLVLLESTVLPGSGYSTLFGTDLGNGAYSVVGGPIDVFGTAMTTSTGGAVSTGAFGFSSDVLSATLTLVGKNSIELTGITLGILAVAGEALPLVIKGDVVFNGTNAVPEPNAAALMLAGLLVVGRRIRRGA